MKKFFKKMTVGSYLCVAAVLLVIVSLIIYCVNSSLPYMHNIRAEVIVFSVLGMLLVAAAAILPIVFGDKPYFAAINIVAVVFIGLALSMSISDRATAMGFVWFSDLEKNNPTAVFALNQAVGMFVTYLISAVLVVVASFFKPTKDTETE